MEALETGGTRAHQQINQVGGPKVRLGRKIWRGDEEGGGGGGPSLPWRQGDNMVCPCFHGRLKPQT